MPRPQLGPTQEVLDANSQHINLAPENQPVDPDRSKAEVSEDSRFRMISPERARYLIAEKMLHTVPQQYLFERVEPVDQSYSGEHQRAHGWTQSRSGTTESGAVVHVRRGEFTSYSVEQEPYYHEDLAVHENGTEISVTYGEPGKDARMLVWFIPKTYDGAHRVPIEQGQKDTPEHITIYDATKHNSLTLTPWSSEIRGYDPRYKAALQEMGTLLGGRIAWNKPNSTKDAALDSAHGTIG